MLGELGERRLFLGRRRRQEAGEEEQRVPGQEEAEQQPGLGEDDRRDDRQRGAAGLVEPPLRLEEVRAEGQDRGEHQPTVASSFGAGAAGVDAAAIPSVLREE